MGRSLDIAPSDQQSHCLPVAGCGQAGEGQEGDGDDEVKEKYELSGNMSSKSVWAYVFDLMKGDNCEQR